MERMHGRAQAREGPGDTGWKDGKNGRSGRIRTCDPRVPNAVLYQTEPHSDERARLIEEAFPGRKRACEAVRRLGILSADAGGVASRKGLRYLHALARGHAPSPFLLGNGVMVTQRFLVPSF